MVVFTDLSISGGRYNGTSLPLAQGLQACRTTRLHWLQTGFTQAENGTFVSDTPALAPYGESTNLVPLAKAANSNTSPTKAARCPR